MQSILYSILIGLVGLLIALCVVWYFLYKNAKEKPPAERKWTDPKFHD